MYTIIKISIESITKLCWTPKQAINHTIKLIDSLPQSNLNLQRKKSIGQWRV